MVRVLKRLKVTFIFISFNLATPILFKNCDDTRDSNSINIKKHLKKVNITSNRISGISDSIDFIIDETTGFVSDKKHERTNSKSIYDNLNIEFNGIP